MDGQRQLFPSAPYMSPQARYPRGYTPDRMAEVRKSLADTEFLTNDKWHHREAFERMVVDTLSRSTMPAAHMERLNSVGTPEWSRQGPNDVGSYYHPTSHITSQYEFPGNSENAGPWRIRGYEQEPLADTRTQRVRTEQILLHEMGHHVSDVHGGRPRRAWTRDHVAETKSGRPYPQEEEAFADDHMVQHYRPHTKDVAAHAAAQTPSYFMGGADQEKAPHYVSHRTVWAPDEVAKNPSLSAQQFGNVKGSR